MRKVMFAGELCSLQFDQYYNGRLSIRLVDKEGMPYATATVNLPDEELGADEVFIKDYSENEGILSALIEAGIVADTGRRVSTGYVVVPVCKMLVGVMV